MSQKIKKLSCANNWISWIMGLGVIPFFFGRFFLMAWEYSTCWWVTVVFLIIPIAFLVWKFIFLKAYIKDINADGKKQLSVWLLNGSTALLIAGAYLAIILFFGLVNPYVYIIPLMLFMLMKVVGMIYDFLLTSKIFNGIKHDTFLGLAIFIVYIITAANSEVNAAIYFAKILAIVLSVVLTALVLKSCLLDKLPLSDHKTIMNFLLVSLLAVGISVYTIYLWFWKAGDESQALFSAVMGIYAAILGGAITLGGVAWTIKDGNEKRQKELERIENERKEEERKKYRPFVNVYAGYNLQGLPSTEPIRGTDWLKNTDKISNVWSEKLNIANNIRDCCFANTDFSNFYVWGIKIDDVMTSFKSYRYIRKNVYFQLIFTGSIYTEKPIEKLSLILEDMLGGLYELKLDFSVNSMYQQIVISGNEPTIFIGEKKMEKTDE